MSGAEWDLVVVGAGTAGLAAAIEAGTAGGRALVLEQTGRIGGQLHISAGQMSAAGTKRQAERGISDAPDAHFADAMRIGRGGADPALVRLAVDLAPSTIDWLMENGFAMAPECPAVLHLHEAYRAPRTYWGVEGGRSILKVLAALFEPLVAAGKVELRLEAKVTRLVIEASGAVAGAGVRSGSGESTVRGRAVLLTTGGYGANPALFRELTGKPLVTCSLPHADGSGIALARAAGAAIWNRDTYLPTLGGIEDPSGSGRAMWGELPLLTPQQRAPWEIFVDRAGRRFVAEDDASVDRRERALLERVDDLTFWIVADEAMARAAPPLLPGWPAAKLAAAWQGHPSFAVAETVAGLARAAGIDAAGLAATVAEFNRAAAAGRDAFGRRHFPLPLATPPYRAIRCHGILLRTAAGLAVDRELRVLDAGGEPIAGLYAAGEAIGGGALSGKSFVGGMSVTPALGFGRWLGRRLAAAGKS